MMMNKAAILHTAVTQYDKENECWVTESPLLETVVGVGDNSDEAQESFLAHFNECYTVYLENRHGLYKKAGRPKKPQRVDLRAQVRPDTRNDIKIYADSLGISQGEAVEVAWKVLHSMTIGISPKMPA
jgi:predicted RNase H-like HicB family nuclease